MAETDSLTGNRGRKAAIKAAKPDNPEAKPPNRKTNVPASEDGPTFWERQTRIAKADWGPRANVYLYRNEPITDRKRSGQDNYIMKYAEPISEDRVMADHGSGKYKAILNYRKPGADEGDQIDSIYFEMLNLQFPPKIPPGEWVDDPRNKKWAWAKQHFAKENGTTDGTNLVQAMDVLNKIQDSTTERVLATMPAPSSGADEVVKIAKVIDVIRPPAPPPDNSLATFMQAELASMRQQIDKGRDREVELMKDMIKETRATVQAPGGLAIVKELVGGLKELLPEVKGLFPAVEEGLGRSRMGGWQEFTIALAPHLSPVLNPIMQAVAARFMMPQNGMAGVPSQQHPNMPPQHPPQLPGAQGAPVTMMPFLQMIAFPMITHIRYCGPPENDDPTEVGKDFARWVYNGFGSDPRYEQAITAARAMGPIGIIGAFRSTPLWGDKGPQNTLASLAEMEGKLSPFFTAFLSWNPEADEEPEEQESEVPEVLTYSGV